MEKFVQQIALDVAGRNLYKYVYAKQGDSGSRFVKATILADGKVMEIGSGMTAKFRAEKPDGKAILNPAVVNDDGTVTVELTKQTLAADGVVDADIVISSASGDELSTVSFKIEVEKAPHGSLTDSKNEMLVLQKLIDDSEAALEKLGNVKDGVSPTVSTAATTGGTKVTITDAKGPHEFVVKNGPAGEPGKGGAPGIVISSTQPTDEAHPVWLDPNGDADGEDFSLGISSATVGQIAKISAVDDNGVPTAWEPVDMPSGGGGQWKKIDEIILTEDTVIAKDAWQHFADGTSFTRIKRFFLHGIIKGPTTGTEEGYVELCINGQRMNGIQYGAQKKGNTREITIQYTFDSWPGMNEMAGRVAYETVWTGNGNGNTVRDATNWENVVSFGLNFPNQSKGYGAGTHLYCEGEIE